MVDERDPDPGTVDWLDLGPEPDVDSERRKPGRWRWWSLLIAAMVAAGLLVTRIQHAPEPMAQTAQRPGMTADSSTRSGTPLTARPLPETHSPPRGTGTPVPGSATDPTQQQPLAGANPVTVIDVGHPFLPVPADWELFGQGPGIVARIELGRGRVTRTSVPLVGSASPIFFVVGQDRVIVHPMDSVAGYVVRDGKPAEQLPPALDQAASALPGPDPWHVWAETETGTATAMSLLTLDGRPAGVQIPIPRDATVQASDRAGNVLMFGIGGMYDLRRDGMHRITGGILLAAGPTRWLAQECDERYRCTSVVIDRATSIRRTISTPLDAYEQNAGVISPDGRTAALLQPNGLGGSNVHLLDLTTGVDRVTGVTTSSGQTLGGRTFVWSPDSRWLFVTNGGGRVLVLDRRGRSVALQVPVGPLDQIALRTTPR